MQCASEWLFARSRPATHTLISINLEQRRMNPWPAALAAAVCVCVCARAKNRGNVRLQRPLGHLCWVRRRLNYPHFNCAVCACRSESAGREEADRRDAADVCTLEHNLLGRSTLDVPHDDFRVEPARCNLWTSTSESAQAGQAGPAENVGRQEGKLGGKTEEGGKGGSKRKREPRTRRESGAQSRQVILD